MRGFAGAFLTLSGWLYLMLMLNLLVAVTCLPVWVLAILVDLRSSWLWVGLAGILVAPALAGVYACFRAHFLYGSYSAVGPYFRAWAGFWRRGWPSAVGYWVFLFVVGADLLAVGRWRYGAVALPVVMVAAAIGLATASVVWTLLPVRTDLSAWAIFRLGVYASVRRLGWSVFSVVALAFGAAVIWAYPAVGLGLMVSPVMYVVWANSRRIARDYLPAGEDREPAPSGA